MKNPFATLTYLWLLVSLAWFPAGAEELRAGRNIGRVDFVDLQNGNLVINDMSYRITSGTAVYSSSGGSVGVQQLKKGVTVRFKTNPATGANQPLVTELYIITAN